MATVLIIGYGNRLRSDDGLGMLAAEQLSQVCPAGGTEVRVCHQLTPELVENISQVEVVVFLDASRVGRPGEIRCTRVIPRHTDVSFVHQLTPATLVSLCHELYGESPAAFEISLSGECFELGEKVSATVAAALPRFVQFVTSFPAEHLNVPSAIAQP